MKVESIKAENSDAIMTSDRVSTNLYLDRGKAKTCTRFGTDKNIRNKVRMFTISEKRKTVSLFCFLLHPCAFIASLRRKHMKKV